jgi:hypothetical protein
MFEMSSGAGIPGIVFCASAALALAVALQGGGGGARRGPCSGARTEAGASNEADILSRYGIYGFHRDSPVGFVTWEEWREEC